MSPLPPYVLSRPLPPERTLAQAARVGIIALIDMAGYAAAHAPTEPAAWRTGERAMHLRGFDRDHGEIHRARTLGRECVEIVRGRALDAIRYAEAYHVADTRVVVIDGQTYSPSTRALPNASLVWGRSDEAWAVFEEEADGVEQIEIEDQSLDTDFGSEDTWTLSWEDGCLIATSPFAGLGD